MCPASSSWFLPLLCQYQSQGQPPGPGSSPSSAGSCPTPPHKGQGSPPPPAQRALLTSPPPRRGFWERICFRVRACSSPSTLVWNFTMDSQAHGSSSGVGRKWGKGKEMVSDCLPGRRVVTARGQNWTALGSVGPGTCKKAETCRGLETELPGVTEGAIPECLPDPSKP